MDPGFLERMGRSGDAAPELELVLGGVSLGPLELRPHELGGPGVILGHNFFRSRVVFFDFSAGTVHVQP